MSVLIALVLTGWVIYVSSGVPDTWSRGRSWRAKLLVASAGLGTSIAFIGAWLEVVR